MELNKLKDLFVKVSLGEATRDEVAIVERIEEDKFFSYLKDFNIGNDNSVRSNEILEVNDYENESPEEELETSYSSVIVETPEVSKVRKFATDKRKLKSFLKKQRIRKIIC